MAKNTVTIKVRIDDKGNLKQVGKKSKQAAEGMDQASKSAGTLDRNLKGAGKASSGAGKNFSKMSQGMGGFVGAYATLAANVFAVSAAFNFLKRSADLEQLRKSQVEFARSSGTALQSVTDRLREASGGMLGFQEAAQAAAIGSAKGFSPQQLEELAVGAGKVSKALGRDFTDSFDRLVRGISKAEPELLDELGITLRLEEATRRYAKALNKNADELTTFERSQAVLVETQRQLNKQFGDFEGSDNAFVKLQKTFEDVVNMVMEKLVPAFSAFANMISNNIGLAIGIFAIIGAKIIGTIPAVAGLGAKINEFVENSKTGMTKAQEDMDEYAASVTKAQDALADASSKAETAFSSAKGGAQDVAKDLTARKGSGLEKLQKGEDPSKRQLAGMLKAAKDNTGEYKKLDKDRRLYFIKQLEIMQKEHGKTHRSFATRAKQSGLKMKSFGLTIQKFVIDKMHRAKKAGIGAFAAIGKGAIGAGKAIRVAMKFTVLAGIFISILDMIDSIIQFPYTFMRNMIEVVIRIGRTFQGLVNAILKGFKAVSNVFARITGKEKTDAFQFEILDETSSEKFLTYLEKAEGGFAGFAGGLLEEAKAYEKVNRAREKYEKTLDKIGEVSKTVAEDLAAVNEGLRGQDASVENSMKRMTAIGTAGISGLLQKALSNAMDDEKVVDSDKAQAGIRKIIDNLGAEAKELSPTLRAALNLPIEQALEKVSQLETQAFSFTSMTNQFSAQIEKAQEALGNDNLSASLAILKPLENTRDALVSIAKESGELTNAQKDLDKAFEFAGGFEKYKALLTLIVAEENRLKQSRHELKLQQADTALLNSAFGAQARERLAIKDAELKRDEHSNTLAAKRLHLLELKAAIGTKAGDPQAVAALKDEIKDMERLGELLERNVDIAESKADDIKKLGITIGDSLTSNLSGAFNALVQGTKSFKDAFKDMAKAILADIAQMITKMLVMRMLTSVFGGNMGSFLGFGNQAQYGSGFGMTDFSSGMNVEAIAKKGGVFGPDYSTGGIARGRQSGYPATLHGTEAVVPLPDNRSIPVEMKGGMGQQNNVTVNVSIDGNGQSQQNSQSDGSMGENLGRLIASAVQDELHFQKRSGGILNPYGVA